MRCSFILICVQCWYIINTLYLPAEVEWANHDSNNIIEKVILKKLWNVFGGVSSSVSIVQQSFNSIKLGLFLKGPSWL